jgi:carbonic anhydrase
MFRRPKNRKRRCRLNSLNGEQALLRLKEGNERFVAKKCIHPNQSVERQAEVVEGQHPFAAILSCSDSRVPPEILFDQGIGDLFIVRVAGNILSDEILGTLEYAAEHLNIPLVLVLGHQRCGAVQAAVKGGEVPGKIQRLVEALRPAVARAKSLAGDPVENAVRANVEQTAELIKKSGPIMTELVHAGKVKVVGGYYSLETGRVTVL